MKGNKMKASEARTMTAKNENYKSIRKEIDKAIECAAKDGHSSMQVSFCEEHNRKRVLESLREDGFKCSVVCNFDPRDGETTYLYSVRW